MDQVLFSPISLEELKTSISDLLDEKIKPLLNIQYSDEKINQILLSRAQVSKQLKISLPTLHRLTLQGTLKSYRMGRRVLYKLNEVEESLQQVITTRYKRKDLL